MEIKEPTYPKDRPKERIRDAKLAKQIRTLHTLAPCLLSRKLKDGEETVNVFMHLGRDRDGAGVVHDKVGVIRGAQGLEAGVDFSNDAACECTQTAVLRPEWVRGVRFGEELGDGEGVVDDCVGEGGDGEDWNPAGRSRFNLWVC